LWPTDIKINLTIFGTSNFNYSRETLNLYLIIIDKLWEAGFINTFLPCVCLRYKSILLNMISFILGPSYDSSFGLLLKINISLIFISLLNFIMLIDLCNLLYVVLFY